MQTEDPPRRLIMIAAVAAATGGAAVNWGSMIAALLAPGDGAATISELYAAVYIALDIAYLVVLVSLAGWPRSARWRIPLGLALPAWLIGIGLLLLFEHDRVVPITITLNSALALFLGVWGILILAGRIGRKRALFPAFIAIAALQSSSDLYWAGQTFAGDPCRPARLLAPVLVAPALWLGLLALSVLPLRAAPADRRAESIAQLLLSALILAGAALGLPDALDRLASQPAAVALAAPAGTFAWAGLCALAACAGALLRLHALSPAPRPAWLAAGLHGRPATGLACALALFFASGIAGILAGPALVAAALPPPLAGMMRPAGGLEAGWLAVGTLATVTGIGLLGATWGLLVDFGTPGAGINTGRCRWAWQLGVGLAALLAPGSAALGWAGCASGATIALGFAVALGMLGALAALLNPRVRQAFQGSHTPDGGASPAG